MMKKLILFDIKSYCKNWRFLFLLVTIIAIGIFGGGNARFTISENLGYNSPYQVAFITAFLSLTSIFFATVLSAQTALKEIDYNLNLIYFALPISKKQFLWSRFVSIFVLSFSFTLILTVSFFIGRSFSSAGLINIPFNIFFYIFPIFIFTAINTFFVVAITASAGWLTKNKLFIYVSGLLLYILYMVSMIFSSSPFMAKNLPQSKQTQFISAILDPFGMSAYFSQTAQLSVQERNTEYVSLIGILLANRLGILLLSVLILVIISIRFSITKKVKSAKVKNAPNQSATLPFAFVPTEISAKVKIQSLFSFTKMNWLYVVKSIPFVLIVLSLLFAVGMEMYAEIEKGIRIPQKYASSGLMVSTIIENFYVIGALVLVFYGNDLFWRSKASNFNYIEESTTNYRVKFWSIWLTLIGLSIVFTTVLILEGIAFQMLYQYPNIEWNVYAKTFLYNTLPLILVAGFTLIFQKLIKNKYLALAISGLFVLLMTTSLGKSVVKYPLLKFLQTISFDYSDMNGFGSYENAFAQRLFFGFMILIVLLYCIHQNRQSVMKAPFWLVLFCSIGLASFVGKNIVTGYVSKDSNKIEMEQINYEKQFRAFQNKPQPTITKVTTRVDLFPSKNAYSIKGNYVLENKTEQPISEILVNFSADFEIKKAVLRAENEAISINNQCQIIRLQQAITPNQKISLEYELFYQWKPINGHQSFNAIVENGSFMRISRYYPQIGYDASYEIEDENSRNQYQLGKRTPITSLEAPKVFKDDFISLDMTVSTEAKQTVIGVGELTKQWNEKDRPVFQFKVDDIPFRFAISSANYAVTKDNYKGKSFEVYYHPAHAENVAYLIKNAKITMDYCETNFGNYPFKTIRFAEISGFTKGFNATAYPAAIYMNESLAFHCNILADKKQDVINELAGHELAHLWWGNSQIDPDDREGRAMLTETLAMYTELMLLKKMYGKPKVEESIAMHQDFFNSEKGFLGDAPLIKVLGDQSHVSYSKGVVAMYQLSELISEDKVNLALKNFLALHKYPASKPISTDFIEEVYKVSDKKYYKQIKKLFEE
jgi:ABC-2 type transport system permease protein